MVCRNTGHNGRQGQRVKGGVSSRSWDVAGRRYVQNLQMRASDKGLIEEFWKGKEFEFCLEFDSTSRITKVN